MPCQWRRVSSVIVVISRRVSVILVAGLSSYGLRVFDMGGLVEKNGSQ